MTGMGNTYACVHGVNMVYDMAWDFFFKLHFWSGVGFQAGYNGDGF